MEQSPVERFRRWLVAQPLRRYTDAFGTECFGTAAQAHIVHLHEDNNHADIEINDAELFVRMRDAYDLEAHPWHQDNWLIIRLTNEERVSAAQSIISELLSRGAA